MDCLAARKTSKASLEMQHGCNTTACHSLLLGCLKNCMLGLMIKPLLLALLVLPTWQQRLLSVVLAAFPSSCGRLDWMLLSPHAAVCSSVTALNKMCSSSSPSSASASFSFSHALDCTDDHHQVWVCLASVGRCLDLNIGCCWLYTGVHNQSHGEAWEVMVPCG